jgi:hypothetical protein
MSSVIIASKTKLLLTILPAGDIVSKIKLSLAIFINDIKLLLVISPAMQNHR